MAVIEIAKIQVRRGKENTTGVPRLDPGEFGWAEDTEHLYIGKRIVEGANSDENSRILTENDLSNVFSLLGANSTLTIITPYRYRDTILAHTTTTTVQRKLDDYVGLTDFGVAVSATATDITQLLRYAIQDLYQGTDNDRRQLNIPAGNYYISSTIELPPCTTLVGQGSDITRLVYTSNANSMFKTVDGSVNNYESGVSTGTKFISISGMTLAYASSATTGALISLDEASDAVIEDVKFTTSGTFTMTNYGVGISLRGTGGNGLEKCRDIHINRCEFESLKIGIEGTGTVMYPVISDNVFNNLQQGIKFYGSLITDTGPRDGLITGNRFENIVKEAIFIGTSSFRTNHVSENNIFRIVGNGADGNGNPINDIVVTTALYPIITFYGEGNRSINDHFERQVSAYTTSTSSAFYYNPLVIGHTTVVNGAIYTATVFRSVTNNSVKLPLTGRDQKFTIEYSMSNDNYSRKGMLIANITSGTGVDAYGSVFDHYDYSYVTSVTNPTFNISTGTATKNYVVLTCNNTNSEDYNLSYQINSLS
jgi:hypothetical protein